MIVSVEVPAFKGGWLRPCVDSVLGQSSPHWRLSLVWDGGDEESRSILEELERREDPRISVYFSENRGIARARQFLSEHSEGDFILPLDDDDALPFHAIERFLEVAASKPWASIIRAKRKFIDLKGKVVDKEQWFPFELRHYQHGMVTDLFNHSQPYLIRRSAFDRTEGWEGFEDFMFAGEDCDVYLKLEETGSIELLDETLYYYRINPDRASDVLTPEAAFEMWRRLADKTIERIGLPLVRTNESVPFEYERQPTPEPTLEMVDFVVSRARAGKERIPEDELVAQLAACGVSQDAVQVVDDDRVGSTERNRLSRSSSRPLVCFVDSDVALDEPQKLSDLLARMHERRSDLAAPAIRTTSGTPVCAQPGFSSEGEPVDAAAGDRAPEEPGRDRAAAWLCEKMVMMRREVLNAVGGFDPDFEGDRHAMVDLCLKARERDFACDRIGTVVFRSSDDAVAAPVWEADTARLREKWASYPPLFEPVDGDT